jgi:hypothetical protein
VSDVSKNNLTFQLEHDSEIIADNLKIKGTSEKSGQKIVEEVMQTIVSLGLLQENEGLIYGFKILKRMDTSMTSNSVFRKMIQNAKYEGGHDDAMKGSCKNRIEENRREEIRTEENRLEQSQTVSDKKPNPFRMPKFEAVEKYFRENEYTTNPKEFYSYYHTQGFKTKNGKPIHWYDRADMWEENSKPKILKIDPYDQIAKFNDNHV